MVRRKPCAWLNPEIAEKAKATKIVRMEMLKRFTARLG